MARTFRDFSCPNCKIAFKSREKDAKFCSRSCALKFTWYYTSRNLKRKPIKKCVFYKECLQCNNIILRWVRSEAMRDNWNFCSRSCQTTFNNRGNVWNLGKTHSEEFKRRLSKIKTGLPNYKNRLITGDKHWNWQGGKTSWRHKISNCAEYKDWRKSVFERDGYTCQECGIRNRRGLGKRVILNADHIKPVCLYPNLIYNLDNGRTLCLDCHIKTDTFGVGALRYVENK